MLMLDSDVNDRQVLLQNKQESPIERERRRDVETQRDREKRERERERERERKQEREERRKYDKNEIKTIAEASKIFDVACCSAKVPMKINKQNKGCGQSINLLE